MGKNFEMYEYVQQMVNDGKSFDASYVAKMFNSSKVAVINAKNIAEHGDSARKKKRSTMSIASCENSRAARLKIGGIISEKEWISVLVKYKNKCVTCGTTENISMDHIKPLSRGGTHTIDNIQPMCRSCNSRKGNRHA